MQYHLEAPVQFPHYNGLYFDEQNCLDVSIVADKSQCFQLAQAPE